MYRKKENWFWPGMVSIFLMGMALWSGPAQAQIKYPNRPISLIVPMGVGGAIDVTSRVLAANLSEKFGVPVNVINKPGGNMVPATLEVMNSAPDGYTILSETVNCSFLVFQKDLPFKITDRTFMAIASSAPLMPVVHSSAPWKTFADLAEAIKKKPEGFAVVSAGVTNVTGLAVRQLFSVLGVDFLKAREILIKSGAEQIALIAGKNAHLTFLAPASSLPSIKGGVLRSLAITSRERIPQLKDVPTTRELGYPTLDAQLWVGFSGPPRLPAEIVEIWNQNLQKVLKDPRSISQLDKVGMVPYYHNADETRRTVLKEMAEVQKLVPVGK